MTELKPCPFCGGVVDPEGLRGPECEGCGATATSIESWELRVDNEIVQPSSGMTPLQAFEHHIANPNLFRSLATRLDNFSIFAKIADYPMDEGEIGPDCARAALLFRAMADVVEESKE